LGENVVKLNQGLQEKRDKVKGVFSRERQLPKVGTHEDLETHKAYFKSGWRTICLNWGIGGRRGQKLRVRYDGIKGSFWLGKNIVNPWGGVSSIKMGSDGGNNMKGTHPVCLSSIGGGSGKPAEKFKKPKTPDKKVFGEKYMIKTRGERPNPTTFGKG